MTMTEPDWRDELADAIADLRAALAHAMAPLFDAMEWLVAKLARVKR